MAVSARHGFPVRNGARIRWAKDGPGKRGGRTDTETERKSPLPRPRPPPTPSAPWMCTVAPTVVTECLSEISWRSEAKRNSGRNAEARKAQRRGETQVKPNRIGSDRKKGRTGVEAISHLFHGRVKEDRTETAAGLHSKKLLVDGCNAAEGSRQIGCVPWEDAMAPEVGAVVRRPRWRVDPSTGPQRTAGGGKQNEPSNGRTSDPLGTDTAQGDPTV